MEVLAYDAVDFTKLTGIWPELAGAHRQVAEQMEIEAAYAGYLDRQEADILAFRKDEDMRLPADLDYRAVGGLSNEAKEKLIAVRPATLGQAARIEGLTPGAMTALLGHLRRVGEGARRGVSFPATDEDGFGPEDVLRLTGVSRETLSRIWALPGRARGVAGANQPDRSGRGAPPLEAPCARFPAAPRPDLSARTWRSPTSDPGQVFRVWCWPARWPTGRGRRVTLVEKSVRKSQFLEAAIAAVGLPARVLNQRLEDAPPTESSTWLPPGRWPLCRRLLGYAHGWLKPSGKALLMKGRDAVKELTLAREILDVRYVHPTEPKQSGRTNSHSFEL